MTISEKLISINNTKQAIKASIEAKGQTIGTIPFDQYPAKIDAIVSGGSVVDPDEWVRPSDWLPMPEVLPTEQKIVGLVAVTNDEVNYVSFVVNNNYTVDWGDGVVQNFIAGNSASHQYIYADLPDSSLSSRGYKQVLITVTPQSGKTFPSINFQNKHPSIVSTVAHHQWLDILISSPTISYVKLGSTSHRHPLLERVRILSWSPFFTMDVSYQLFNTLTALQTVTIPSTKVSSFSYAFYNCPKLKKIVGVPDTSSVTDFSYAFTGSYSLREIPAINTSNATNVSYAFNGCYSAMRLPPINTSKVTNFSGAFNGCYSLIDIPPIDVSGGTGFVTTFYGCGNLRSINATGFNQTFDISNTKLSATELNNVFNNLATVTGKTITITGCPGAATCDKTIATAKGWTVTA